MLAATLKGPRLAPSTRLINDLKDHGLDGVSGQQPPPIFHRNGRYHRGYQWLMKKRSLGANFGATWADNLPAPGASSCDPGVAENRSQSLRSSARAVDGMFSFCKS